MGAGGHRAVFSLFYVGPNLEGARYVYLPAADSHPVRNSRRHSGGLDGAPGPRKPFHVPGARGCHRIGAAATTADLARWRRAASTRDTILAIVRGDLDRLNCTTFSAEGIADNIEGAYVLRNGVTEALDLRNRTPAGRCRLVEADGRVVVLRTETNRRNYHSAGMSSLVAVTRAVSPQMERAS